MKRITMTLLAVLFTVTLVTPARAQDGPALWLPYVARDAIRNWFTIDELAKAESRVIPPLPFWGEYVDCELLPGSNPDVLVQLSSCTQPYEVDAEGNPVGSATVYFWFEPATNRVEWVVMSAIRTEVQP